MNTLVTIVTPSFNQAQFIEETIQSVLTQDYQPIEYLVMDGGSKDGTLDILRKYEDRLTWVSERDKGQGDAINKGFRSAKGEILGWLNSDDVYAPGAIRAVAEYFDSHPDVSLVYGDAMAITLDGKSAGMRVHIRPASFESLRDVGDFIVQPAAFWRADLWKTVGELDLKWQYVLDYEYWIRAAQHYELRYIPHLLAKERIYAAAKTFRGGIERTMELDEMPRRFGGSGIASGFRSEGSALFLFRALDHLRHGRIGDARTDWRTARYLNNDLTRMLLYFGALLWRGEAGIPGLFLSMNRLRNAVRRNTAAE